MFFGAIKAFRKLALLWSLVCLSTMPVFAEVQIDVLALFQDAALLNIDGKQVFLRRNEAAKQGVRLLSATSQEVLIEVEGKQRRLLLSTHISSEFKAAAPSSVSILRNQQGQYRITGKINQTSVEFLVDTGATVVAMNSYQARALGINYQNGKVGKVRTASGIVPSYGVVLDQVRLGTVKVPNVQAVVIEGEFPALVLLGMSFLQFVDLQESSGVMRLNSKFAPPADK